jgi:hypothetical protein
MQDERTAFPSVLTVAASLLSPDQVQTDRELLLALIRRNERSGGRSDLLTIRTREEWRLISLALTAELRVKCERELKYRGYVRVPVAELDV